VAGVVSFGTVSAGVVAGGAVSVGVISVGAVAGGVVAVCVTSVDAASAGTAGGRTKRPLFPQPATVVHSVQARKSLTMVFMPAW